MSPEEKIKALHVGDSASEKMVATDEAVRTLASVSGDNNPVHLDDDFAKTTFFKKRIAHGLFCLGMVSGLLGMRLPGNGSILVKETVNYKAPVYIGDEIETTVTVIEIIAEKNRVNLSFACVNQEGNTVMDGTALVLIV